MVLSTAGKNADIVISGADGSSDLVRLKLQPGSWVEEPITPTLPPQPTGDINYSSRAPEFGRVYSQNNWTAGFGLARVQEHTSSHHYGYSNGVLCMFEGELVPGYLEDHVDAILRNPRFETGNTNGWDDGANTTVASSTSSRNGSYALSVTATANGGTATQNYLGTDAVLQSIEITAVAYIKRSSGTGTISLGIADGVGTTTSSTSSATDWTLVEVTRTIDALATAVQFIFTLSTSGDVFLIDDVGVILTGGSEWKGKPVKFGANYYGIMGRAILKFDEGNDAWLPVYVDPAYEITAISSYSSSLYAGRGVNDNYLTSSDGTTWSDPSTNSGNNRLATFFARVKNSRGDWALMKTRANFISITTSPGDTANWGAEIQAGDADRSITSLTAATGTAYVGREDGLFVYNARTNIFEDIEPDANFFPSTNNFKAMIGRSGSVWASGGEQTFWKASPSGLGAIHNWENLSHLIQSNAYKGFGGNVTALAQDRANVFVALSDNSNTETGGFPYTFPFAFNSSGLSSAIQLLTIRNMRKPGSDTLLEAEVEVNVAIHNITKFDVSALDQLGRLDDGNVSSLFAMGSATDSDITATDKDVPRAIRLRIPRDNENPRRANNINVRTSAKFYTPFVDFNYPDTEKGQVTMTIGSRNFSAGAKYVIVRYKTDDDTDDDSTGWTEWGDDGIFDTSPQELKAAILNTPVTFKRIRFEIEFVSDATDEDPPTVTSMVFQAAWNEREPRKFRGSVKLSDRRSMQLRRVPQTTVRAVDLANLTTLRKRPFIQLVTPTGEVVNAKLGFLDRTISSRVDALRGGPVDQVRVVDLEFTEYLTS